MANETKAKLQELNDTLNEANENLRKQIVVLENAIQSRTQLTNSLAGYLRLINEQLHTTIESIEQVLVSHDTLSISPLPPVKKT